MSSLDYRFIFAGGGTGGHLFPAIAVAAKIRELKPGAKILFVGTKHKIESRVVPKYGFDFKTIWVSGFARKFTLKNILFPIKMITSMIQSLFICIKFKPDVAVGAGAYVSGPVLWGASIMGAKIVLLEQNSYPGITNRLLEKRADEIHISFEESKKYFRFKNKLKLSGNPVNVNSALIHREDALKKFGLNPEKQTVLILGGSLGALSINNAVKNTIEKILSHNIQLLWQTGELYYDKYKNYESENVKVKSFIDDMTAAYSSADIVIARAGATTIAEISYLGLPVIFIPSPNVAADHQFKNAETLFKAGAAHLIEDNSASEKLYETLIRLLNDDELLNRFRNNIKRFSFPDASINIANSIISLIEKKIIG